MAHRAPGCLLREPCGAGAVADLHGSAGAHGQDVGGRGAGDAQAVAGGGAQATQAHGVQHRAQAGGGVAGGGGDVADAGLFLEGHQSPPSPLFLAGLLGAPLVGRAGWFRQLPIKKTMIIFLVGSDE